MHFTGWGESLFRRGRVFWGGTREELGGGSRVELRGGGNGSRDKLMGMGDGLRDQWDGFGGKGDGLGVKGMN